MVPNPADLDKRFQHDPLRLDLSLMTKRDIDRVIEIDAQSEQRAWSRSLFENELSLGDKRAYTVARCDGEIVAFCGVMYVEPESHITTIAVDENWRRRGAASALMVQIIDAAIERNCTEVGLEVRATNTSAQAMYRKFGFVPLGVRRNYYSDTGDDALVMWLYDIDSHDYATRLNSIRAQIRHVDHEWRT